MLFSWDFKFLWTVSCYSVMDILHISLIQRPWIDSDGNFSHYQFSSHGTVIYDYRHFVKTGKNVVIFGHSFVHYFPGTIEPLTVWSCLSGNFQAHCQESQWNPGTRTEQTCLILCLVYLLTLYCNLPIYFVTSLPLCWNLENCMYWPLYLQYICIQWS